MKNKLQISLFLIFSLFFLSSNLFAKKMYINSLQITPNSQPQSSATKLNVTIPRGTAVEQLDVQNSWSKIKFNNQEGWVPNIVLSDKQPMNKVSPLNNNDVDISKSSRRRASGYTSAAAARGLTESGRKRVNTMQAPDYEALEKMEKGKANEKEAVEFLNNKEEKPAVKENN